MVSTAFEVRLDIHIGPGLYTLGTKKQTRARVISALLFRKQRHNTTTVK